MSERRGSKKKRVDVPADALNPPTRQIMVFTRAYNAFRFGPAHNFVKCRVAAVGPYPLGKGISVYVVTDPEEEKRQFIAEATTGAFVGSNLEVVRYDVENAESGVMEQQIEDAKKQRATAQRIPPALFWAMLRRGNPLKKKEI